MSNEAFIVGVGMTNFSVHHNASISELCKWAIDESLEDAGAHRTDVEAIFFGNTTQPMLQDQLMIGGQIAMRANAFEEVPVFNVENACATGGSALHLATTSVLAGNNDVALAVGVEKMNIHDRLRTMAVFNGGYDVSQPSRLRELLEELGGRPSDEEAGDRSIFMDIYAAMARAHMATFGTTGREIAAVASKNHLHAVDNVRAHYRKAMSIEEVLDARPLSYPLTVPMCAPITDGAAAVLVCNEQGVRRFRGGRAVRVLASEVGTGMHRDLWNYEQHITRIVGQRAYERAGVGPQDISVAEVHDATAFAEILITELLGLVPWGSGGRAAVEGVTRLGGRIPTNPSGGLESKGHPLGATGLAQVFELVSQLRGEAGSRQVVGARIGLAENGGGFLEGEEAVTAVTILSAA